MQIVGLHQLFTDRNSNPLTVTSGNAWRFFQFHGFIDFSLINNNQAYCCHDAIYLQKNNIKPYTKPIHTVKSQVTDTQLPKNSSHQYTNATAFSNAAIRFIRPADETMRTANHTWHACDVTSNQWPTSHISSHITCSPVRSSQITKPLGTRAGVKCEV